MRGGGFVCGAPSELSDVQVPPGISIGGLTRSCASKISIGGETSSALTNRLILFQILRECKGDSLHEKDQTKQNTLVQLTLLITLNFMVQCATVQNYGNKSRRKKNCDY